MLGFFYPFAEKYYTATYAGQVMDEHNLVMQQTYKIGEAADMLNLKTYVLRFWETEFPQLAPLRTQKGQRLYTDQHITLLKHIKHLLHERGMTIEGAKRELQAQAKLTQSSSYPDKTAMLSTAHMARQSSTSSGTVTTWQLSPDFARYLIVELEKVAQRLCS